MEGPVATALDEFIQRICERLCQIWVIEAHDMGDFWTMTIFLAWFMDKS